MTADEPKLTPRLQEICDLLVRGWTAKQIGERLSISHRTVESHIDRLYERFGVSGRIELVRMVLGEKS